VGGQSAGLPADHDPGAGQPSEPAAFGSAGTADDSSLFTQLRELRISVVSARATVGVVTGPAGADGGRDKGEA